MTLWLSQLCRLVELFPCWHSDTLPLGYGLRHVHIYHERRPFCNANSRSLSSNTPKFWRLYFLVRSRTEDILYGCAFWGSQTYSWVQGETPSEVNSEKSPKFGIAWRTLTSQCRDDVAKAVLFQLDISFQLCRLQSAHSDSPESSFNDYSMWKLEKSERAIYWLVIT